jgi:hypothetical protein
MKTIRPTKTKVLSGTFAAIVTIAMLGVLFGSAAHASGADVSLSPMAGAPNASGEAEIEFAGAVMQGSVRVENLPSQPFGSGRFYGAWFVRTDTGNKAFLGALIGEDSIIFSAGGEGATNFAATKFTTGPNAGVNREQYQRPHPISCRAGSWYRGCSSRFLLADHAIS